MSKETIIIEKCDLCGKEVETYNVKVLTYRTFDSEEGMINYSKKHYENPELDLCEECLEKTAVIHSVGIMCEKYVLEDKE